MPAAEDFYDKQRNQKSSTDHIAFNQYVFHALLRLGGRLQIRIRESFSTGKANNVM